MIYLTKIRNRLVALRDGITANPTAWTGMPHTPSTVQGEIDAIDVMDAEIANLLSQIESKRLEAKNLALQKEAIADGIENMMKSIHATEKSKWPTYGVHVTVRQSKDIPKASLNIDVEDDGDGEGFVIRVQKADPDARMYLWQRGVSDDPSNLNVVPTLVQFAESTKAEIIDDDVEPGKRYFYRVRAANSKGKGNWSDIASKVQ